MDVPAAKHGGATAENIETSPLFLHQGNTFACEGMTFVELSLEFCHDN